MVFVCSFRARVSRLSPPMQVPPPAQLPAGAGHRGSAAGAAVFHPGAGVGAACHAGPAGRRDRRLAAAAAGGSPHFYAFGIWSCYLLIMDTNFCVRAKSWQLWRVHLVSLSASHVLSVPALRACRLRCALEKHCCSPVPAQTKVPSVQLGHLAVHHPLTIHLHSTGGVNGSQNTAPLLKTPRLAWWLTQQHLLAMTISSSPSCQQAGALELESVCLTRSVGSPLLICLTSPAPVRLPGGHPRAGFGVMSDAAEVSVPPLKKASYLLHLARRRAPWSWSRRSCASRRPLTAAMPRSPASGSCP
jgi:hypothetical protein